MLRLAFGPVAALALGATAASADFAVVQDRDTFLDIVQGKTLSRPFVKLSVSPEGDISGQGAAWEVEGDWTWQDGYFCRDLFWGGDPLGYNCQRVSADGNRIRFTSDRGSGQSADFRLQ